MGKKRFKEKKYLDHSGNICPYCGSRDISNDGDVETDDNYAWRDVICDDCGSTWRDLYTLTGAEEITNNT